MTGSMNWTNQVSLLQMSTGLYINCTLGSYTQAMDQNWENIRITSDKFIVSTLHNEFNAIWNNPNVTDFRRQSGPKGRNTSYRH